jgi:diguanylate cyclase (GGDEF)-like protein
VDTIITPRMLREAIAAHPQSSLQDALLVFCAMISALLLSLQYDLFYFINELSAAEREISLAEMIFLTALLATGIVIFIIRRLNDQRRDIALKVAAERELRELTSMALQDPLTGLLNRRALIAALDTATASPPANGSQYALFMIDLDHFKSVNDLHGHAVGDQVLEVVADRFKAAARPSDLVARIGGDEFAVLAYNVDKETARKIGSRFLESLTRTIGAGGQAHKVSLSIGIALIPDDGATADEALRNADLAMYCAKERRSALMFFAPDMDQQKQIA